MCKETNFKINYPAFAMNNTLLIIPTYPEAHGLLKKTDTSVIDKNVFDMRELSTDMLICGPGLPACMMQLTQHLHKYNHYQMLVMAGIAGSYTDKLRPGEIVCVEMEKTADIGYIKDKKFHPLTSLDEWKKYYNKGVFINPYQNLIHETGLKNVISNTVNINNLDIPGIPESDIENMEGAGFFMIAHDNDIPFLEIRAISNMVRERNKITWKIDAALKNLHAFLNDYLKSKKI